MFAQTTEYALRSLAEIARLTGGKWVLAHDLSEKLGIPAHYLSKILQSLARSRLLVSQRGRLGGFRMAEGAEKTSVLDVIRQLDDIRKLEGCIMGEERCGDATACPLHEIWKDVRGRFTDELSSTTIRDLADFDREQRASFIRRAKPPHRACPRRSRNKSLATRS